MFEGASVQEGSKNKLIAFRYSTITAPCRKSVKTFEKFSNPSLAQNSRFFTMFLGICSSAVAWTPGIGA